MIPQPAPITTKKSEEVLPMVIRRLSRAEREVLEGELRRRAKQGLETYGVPLMTFNGRDTLQDALDELLDAMKYITQHEHESGEVMINDFAALKGVAMRVASKMQTRSKR